MMVIWNQAGGWFYHTICSVMKNYSNFLRLNDFDLMMRMILPPCFPIINNWQTPAAYNKTICIYGHHRHLGRNDVIWNTTILHKFDIILAYLPQDLLRRRDQWPSDQAWLPHPHLSSLHCLSERYPPHQSHLPFPPCMHI